MPVVVCDLEECKYNKERFCKKNFVFVNGAICNEIADKQGRRKSPEQWVKPEILAQAQQQQN